MPEASVTAYPALNSAALGAADAHDERVGVLRAFERAIYGRVPHLALALGDKSPLACGAIATAPLCERWQAAVSPNGTAFDIIVLAPPAPRAMLICQVFQRAPQSMTRIAEALAGGARWRLGETWLQLLLGRYIHAPPLEWVVRQGFGLAFFCPGDVVPDRVHLAAHALERLAPDAPADERPGAIAGWAGLMSGVRRALADDERFRHTPAVAWGHSRHGKAALLGGAYDQDFAAVIAHQSGRFGAAMTAAHAGETPLQIARAFPHWFCQRLLDDVRAGRAPPVDQHDLLALIAPRPLLLGDASLDFWADPRGARRAVALASCALASEPRTIECFMRAGGHGLNGADWRAFVKFLDARFPGPRLQGTGA